MGFYVLAVKKACQFSHLYRTLETYNESDFFIWYSRNLVYSRSVSSERLFYVLSDLIYNLVYLYNKFI